MGLTFTEILTKTRPGCNELAYICCNTKEEFILSSKYTSGMTESEVGRLYDYACSACDTNGVIKPPEKDLIQACLDAINSTMCSDKGKGQIDAAVIGLKAGAAIAPEGVAKVLNRLADSLVLLKTSCGSPDTVAGALVSLCDSMTSFAEVASIIPEPVRLILATVVNFITGELLRAVAVCCNLPGTTLDTLRNFNSSSSGVPSRLGTPQGLPTLRPTIASSIVSAPRLVRPASPSGSGVGSGPAPTARPALQIAPREASLSRSALGRIIPLIPRGGQ